MTTLAVTRFVAIVRTKPLVQGFVGAVLAVLVMAGLWKAYGMVRWEVYGRNEQRIANLEQTLTNVIQYLKAQEAAKGGK